ncbi:MAG: hypothetical protein AAF828_03055, partial [Bacteroidota bacterium]
SRSETGFITVGEGLDGIFLLLAVTYYIPTKILFPRLSLLRRFFLFPLAIVMVSKATLWLRNSLLV